MAKKNKRIKKILQEAMKYQKKCEINARAHFLQWEDSSNWNKRLGIPVIVLTTLVGSTLFASKALGDSILLEIILGILSIIAAILSALQVTLGLADEAEKYKSAGLRYRSMVRQFDLFIFKYSDKIDDDDTMDSIHEDFEMLVLKLDDLAVESPSIKDKMYYKAASELEEEQKGVEKK